MTSSITPQPGIMDIDIYVGGKGHTDGVGNMVKLSSNENPFGPSPLAKAAYIEQAKSLNYYPDSDHETLRETLANLHGLDKGRIICANGSDEIISFLTQAFAGPGDEVVFTEYGFLMYKVCSLAAGATPVIVGEKNRTTDVDAILEACTENTKLVFVANPNNPTGTMVDMATLERLAKDIPPHTVLVLDSAYAEFVEGYDGGAGLVDAHDNVIMTRTFSKIYGLGGLRLGWAYASEQIIGILSRVRGPFNVNRGALAAGVAAAKDEPYTQKCREQNAEIRDWFAQELDQIGLKSDPSFANFILVRFNDAELAADADLALQENGLYVRAMGGYNLPDCLRITIGRRQDCKRVVDVLRKFLKAQNS